MYSSFKNSTIELGLQSSRSNLVGNTAYDPATFELISSVTATAGATSLTFSSIPGTYSSLQLRGFVLANSGYTVSTGIRFNSDSGTNYHSHGIYADGSTVSATNDLSKTFMYLTYSSAGTSNPMSHIVDIDDYASTTRNKTIRTFTGVDSNGSGESSLFSGLWASTSAVTSITITAYSGQFAATTKFFLYGLRSS
jgi:hypothetical protein